ncbi:hypothetical protein [Thermococcus sp. 21S7]|uniref:hypothetical protein n=1 Tax=Thermococcus sp. 21S7 TaxID=1638221 RepID=UPI00143ABC8A|nr:hypothetical protein [Thermococcus sp. 21S7]NJE60757.1 hypothetical protein [Thermococcus sp. 21S7]
MRLGPLLVLAAIVLMLAAAMVPPVRYAPPPRLRVDSNIYDFTEELEAHNVTKPYLCEPAERILVTCRIRSNWELNRIIAALDGFPHFPIELDDGYDETDVIVFNKSEFYSALPYTCIPRGTVEKHPDLDRERLEGELEAYRELEGLIDDPVEKEFVHNRTVELEALLGLRQREPVCNATFARVILTYPVRRESNAPLMAALWTGVILTGTAGLVMVWRERRL